MRGFFSLREKIRRGCGRPTRKFSPSRNRSRSITGRERRYCSRGTCSLVGHADTTNLHVFRSQSMSLSMAAYDGWNGLPFAFAISSRVGEPKHILVALRFCELQFSGGVRKTEETPLNRSLWNPLSCFAISIGRDVTRNRDECNQIKNFKLETSIFFFIDLIITCIE